MYSMCQLQQEVSAVLQESVLQVKKHHQNQSSLSYPNVCPVQIVYYDGQFDDSRLCVALACTAALAGAAVTNHTEAVKLLKVRHQIPLVLAYSLLSSLRTSGICCKTLICHKAPFCDISS